MGLPTLLLNKPVDFLCVFIQCHFQFPIQQILCQFKITPIHRRNFSALPDTLFFPVADQFDDPHQTLRIIAGDSTVFWNLYLKNPDVPDPLPHILRLQL